MGTIQKASRTFTGAKCEGGYRLIHAAQLFMAWWAYRQGHLEFRDLRAYFALHEMVARRCVMERAVKPRYTVQELVKLTGGKGREQTTASIHRLERAGLVTGRVPTSASLTLPISPLATQKHLKPNSERLPTAGEESLSHGGPFGGWPRRAAPCWSPRFSDTYSDVCMPRASWWPLRGLFPQVGSRRSSRWTRVTSSEPERCWRL